MYKLLKAYHYLYYQLYRWYEKGPSIWMSDWKAELSLDVLGIFVAISIIIYYTIFLDRFFEISDGLFIICFLIIIAIPNFFIFHYRGQWEGIISEFDKLPKRKNSVGGLIVFGVVILIITNMVYAFYLMSLIDWSLYR